MSEINYALEEDSSSLILEESQADYGKIGQNKETKSISEKELNFKYQLIKGRIAENLIQELFLSEGYQVYKYGIENNYPFLLQQIKSTESQQALSLRIAPDLIIYDPENRQVYYAEVKFCFSGRFNLRSNIDRDDYQKSYPNTLFFIATLDGLFEINFDVFSQCRHLDLSSTENKEKYSIANNSHFNLRPKSIEEFERLSQKFFESIPKNCF